MAESNPDTIEIREATVYDGRKPLQIRKLYIDGCHRASVEQQRDGRVKFRFVPCGAFQLQEARTWLNGLLELLIIAEEMENAKKEKD